jgi:hypothetical protein
MSGGKKKTVILLGGLVVFLVLPAVAVVLWLGILGLSPSPRLKALKSEGIVLEVHDLRCTVGPGFDRLKSPGDIAPTSAQINVLIEVYDAHFGESLGRRVGPPLIVKNQKGQVIGSLTRKDGSYRFTGPPLPSEDSN